VPSGHRLPQLNPSGPKLGISTRLRGLSNRSIVVFCNYKMARYRRYHPAQTTALSALVDPISPPPKPVLAGLWWRRRVLPPGPMGLLRRPFIAIAGLPRHIEYKHSRLPKKEQPDLAWKHVVIGEAAACWHRPE